MPKKTPICLLPIIARTQDLLMVHRFVENIEVRRIDTYIHNTKDVKDINMTGIVKYLITIIDVKNKLFAYL